jgi:EAL domain-containing protein (putative c-di-GMP-specific phosphodiesterase class I)/CheY-like chemotaxis protein
MKHQIFPGAFQTSRFGRRKMVPRVCVVDAKAHIRKFLAESLEELGFIPGECTAAAEMGMALNEQAPDLVVMGLSAGGGGADAMLQALGDNGFDGKVLLLGARGSLVLDAAQKRGEELGLAMLAPLITPFGSNALHASVAALMPVEGPPSPVVDAAEAIGAGWLELWYQPKFSAQTLQMHGAEALVRVRHPNWGIVPPACFLPDAADPALQALSDFVIGRAFDDCAQFGTERQGIEIAINLPIGFFHDPQSIADLCRQISRCPALKGLIVEMEAADVAQNIELVQAAARQLRFGNIALSLDDLGSDWDLLLSLHECPFVEIKVDRTLISGCADDRLKQVVCRQIIEFADRFGARTVAEGVETRADFFAVRELGFDLAQGFLLAKPMTAQKFAQASARQPALEH